jgi:hypothetical protein
MRNVVALLLLAFCAPALAQGVFKCRDAAGKVTYASQECDRIGLKDAGAVKDTLQISPAQKVPVPPPAAKAAKPASAAAQAAPAPAPTVKDSDPERRCFKTAKGFRCNDVPEDGKGG